MDWYAKLLPEPRPVEYVSIKLGTSSLSNFTPVPATDEVEVLWAGMYAGGFEWCTWTPFLRHKINFVPRIAYLSSVKALFLILVHFTHGKFYNPLFPNPAYRPEKTHQWQDIGKWAEAFK